MRIVLAMALIATLMSGAADARPKQRVSTETTCAEWTNAIVAGHPFGGGPAIEYAKKVLIAAEMNYFQHGERGLFSIAPPETATEIAIEAGQKCVKHPEVQAFIA